jgi:hypothetical protein
MQPPLSVISSLSAKTHSQTIKKEQRSQHMKQKGQLLKNLHAVEKLVGNEYGCEGELHRIQSTTPSQHIQTRITTTIRQRDQLLRQWGEICRRETQLFFDDKGYADAVAGESCCRQFFQDKKTDQTHSHVDHVITPNGQKVKGTNRILKEARRHFGAKGKIFNLQEPKNDPNRRTILQAIREDNRVLDKEQSDTLSLHTLFTPEHIQQAIDELTPYTQTGEDGWTAEFFKVIGKRIRGEDDPDTRMPSPSHIY